MNAPDPLPFENRAGFHEAVMRVLGASSKDIVVVDRNFRDWPLESPECDAVLREALRSGARVRLLVAEPDWLERNAARFMRTRRAFADRIECRAIPASLRIEESLIVGDRRHVARRIPPEASRGICLLDSPIEAIAASERAEAAWEELEPCLPATTLGL